MTTLTKEAAEKFLYLLQQDPDALHVTDSCPRWYSTGKGSTQCKGTVLFRDEQSNVGICETCLSLVYLDGDALRGYDSIGLEHPREVPAWSKEQFKAGGIN